MEKKEATRISTDQFFTSATGQMPTVSLTGHKRQKRKCYTCKFEIT